MLPIFIDREDERKERKLKFFKISQNSLKAQFASERLKSRSRFFERVRNRWGVQKFLRSKPKTNLGKKIQKVAKKSQRAK